MPFSEEEEEAAEKMRSAERRGRRSKKEKKFEGPIRRRCLRRGRKEAGVLILRVKGLSVKTLFRLRAQKSFRREKGETVCEGVRPGEGEQFMVSRGTFSAQRSHGRLESEKEHGD